MLKGFLKILLLLLLLSGDFAFAQDSGRASAGTLMAAVMEQVGYRAQSQILNDLAEHLEWAGSLIYLGVLVSILITVSLLGNYRSALWLLVGPTMFFYMSGIEVAGYENTVQAAGVEWRFGVFDDTQDERQKDNLLKEQNLASTSEVAFFFHRYNVMISEIYQRLISEITNRDVRAQMMFMSRQRIFDALITKELENSQYDSLVFYFLNHCSTEMSDAKYLAEGIRDGTDGSEAEWLRRKDSYCEGWVENKPFEPGAWQNVAYASGNYQGLFVSREDHLGEEGKVEHGLTTCKNMWSWIIGFAENSAKAEMDEEISQMANKSLFINSGYMQEAFEGINKKATEDSSDPDKSNTRNFSCDNGNTDDRPRASNALQKLARVASAFIIRKKLSDPAVNSEISRIGLSSGGFKIVNSTIAGTLSDKREAVLKRQTRAQHSDSREIEAITFLSLLPYMQGFILYVLSVTYPFFCLMLLLPGQAGAFLSWLALWAWVKSWDVGLAFVMVADEILWELLPQSSYIDSEKAENFIEPVNLLEYVFDGDPSFNSSTYWLLLVGMVSAVPIVTANIFLGIKKALGGLVVQGLNGFGEAFGGGAANFTASTHTTAQIEDTQKPLGDNLAGRVANTANQGKQAVKSLNDAQNSNSLNTGNGFEVKQTAKKVKSLENQISAKKKEKKALKE